MLEAARIRFQNSTLNKSYTFNLANSIETFGLCFIAFIFGLALFFFEGTIEAFADESQDATEAQGDGSQNTTVGRANNSQDSTVEVHTMENATIENGRWVPYGPGDVIMTPEERQIKSYINFIDKGLRQESNTGDQDLVGIRRVLDATIGVLNRGAYVSEETVSDIQEVSNDLETAILKRADAENSATSSLVAEPVSSSDSSDSHK